MIELVVVVVILAVVSAFAAPGFMNAIQKVRTESSQSDLVGMLKEAKRIARSESTTVVVTLANNNSSNSTITLSAGSGLTKNTTLYESIVFEDEATVTFNAIGTVTPPNGESMFRLVVVNEETNLKRYVDVTASGQIVAHFANFNP